MDPNPSKPPAEEVRPKSRFTLGTRLTIFNGVCWVVLIILGRLGVWPAFLPLLVLSLPLAIFFFPGGHGFWSEEEVWVFVTVVGINSMLWGHGLAWIIGKGSEMGWVSGPFAAQFAELRDQLRQFSLRTLLVIMTLGAPLLASLWRPREYAPITLLICGAILLVLLIYNEIRCWRQR